MHILHMPVHNLLPSKLFATNRTFHLLTGLHVNKFDMPFSIDQLAGLLATQQAQPDLGTKTSRVRGQLEVGGWV